MRDFYCERNLQQREVEQHFGAWLTKQRAQRKKQDWEERSPSAFTQWYDKLNYDWRNNLFPHAAYLRHEILARLPDQKDDRLIDDATFYGIGANAIPAAAEKLDILAKTLCPKAGWEDSFGNTTASGSLIQTHQRDALCPQD
jgi:hypothetical protein